MNKAIRKVLCTIIINIQNIKRWCWWNYYQDSNGETDIDNRPEDMGGKEKGESELYGEGNMESYNTMCKIDRR